MEQLVFEQQLSLYKRIIARVLKNILAQVLKPLFEFQDPLVIYVHHYLAQIVDPEFKTLRDPFMKLYMDNPLAGRKLVAKYGAEILVALLVKIQDDMLVSNRMNVAAQNVENVPLEDPIIPALNFSNNSGSFHAD